MTDFSTYSPGLHALCRFEQIAAEKLTQLDAFHGFTQDLCSDLGLEIVGSSSFVFENQSYTSSYCLKESHICIHTWPEFQLLTLDVYLCNFLQDNSEKVRTVVEKYRTFFAANEVSISEVYR